MPSEGFKGLPCPPLRGWTAATHGKSKIICYLCHPATFLTPISCFKKIKKQPPTCQKPPAPPRNPWRLIEGSSGWKGSRLHPGRRQIEDGSRLPWPVPEEAEPREQHWGHPRTGRFWGLRCGFGLTQMRGRTPHPAQGGWLNPCQPQAAPGWQRHICKGR